MRSLYYILLVAAVVGCASVSDVPVPKTTRYDKDTKAKKAYLEGYRLGYRMYLAGEANGPGPDVFSGDPIATARMFGWFDGRDAAVAVSESQHQRDRAIQEGRTK